jgi:hypothetical protein
MPAVLTDPSERDSPAPGCDSTGHIDVVRGAERAVRPPGGMVRASTTVLQHLRARSVHYYVCHTFRFRSGPTANGRCPARTGDLLLVRREHLLRSTAVRRSDRLASDGTLRAAAFCCGLPLPQRFHITRRLSRESDSEVGRPRDSCFSSKAAAVPSPGSVLLSRGDSARAVEGARWACGLGSAPT